MKYITFNINGGDASLYKYDGRRTQLTNDLEALLEEGKWDYDEDEDIPKEILEKYSIQLVQDDIEDLDLSFC